MRFEMRNDMAIVGWSFMLVWLGFLAMVTWLFVRDGGFHQFHPLLETGIVLMFWTFGLAGGGHVFSKPRVKLTVAHGLVEVSERWMVRRRIERFAAADVAVTVIDGKDDEGDPYFTCVVALPSGRSIVAKESHDRAAVEAAHQRLAAAIG